MQKKAMTIRFSVQIGDHMVSRLGWEDRANEHDITMDQLVVMAQKVIKHPFQLGCRGANGNFDPDITVNKIIEDKKRGKRRQGRVIVKVSSNANKKLISKAIRERSPVIKVPDSPEHNDLVLMGDDSDEDFPVLSIKRKRNRSPRKSTAMVEIPEPLSSTTIESDASTSSVSAEPVASLPSVSAEPVASHSIDMHIHEHSEIHEDSSSAQKSQDELEVNSLQEEESTDALLDEWNKLMEKKTRRQKLARKVFEDKGSSDNLVKKTLIYEAHGHFSLNVFVPKTSPIKILYDFVCKCLDPEVAPACFHLQTKEGDHFRIDSPKLVEEAPQLLFIIEENYELNDTITNHDEVWLAGHGIL